MPDWLKIAQEILEAVEIPTLATVGSDGTPRAVPLLGELKQGVFTWRSLPTRVHSQQVKQNPRMAFNFFDAKKQRSVYGVGTVERTEKDEDFLRYYARVNELWVVINEQIGGKFFEPYRLDPTEL